MQEVNLGDTDVPVHRVHAVNGGRNPPTAPTSGKQARPGGSPSLHMVRRWLDGKRAWVREHRAAVHRVGVVAGHTLVAVYIAFAVLHWQREGESRAPSPRNLNSNPFPLE